MTKQRRQAVPIPFRSLQLPMAFTARRVLEPKQRADVVSLLSRLLLQAAAAQNEREVRDDHA